MEPTFVWLVYTDEPRTLEPSVLLPLGYPALVVYA